MRRRDFLASSLAVSVGLAGCSDGDDATTDGITETDTATGTATERRTETQTATETETESDEPLPRLHTEDNWIVDAAGNQVVLRGANLVEPLFCDTVAEARGANFEATLELALNEDDGWYNRVLRLPINYWGIQGEGAENEFDGDMEAYLEEYVDTAVQRCKAENTYIIIDYHLIKDWNTDETDAWVREFWDLVAPRYADEPHVLYQPINEPQAPRDNTLENWEAFKTVFTDWLDMIRAEAPETPIIVSSPDYNNLTRFAAESPIDGENLIYAGHIYPGDGTGSEDLDPHFGAPAEDVPVMITEWGFDATDDTQPGDREWGTAFRAWLESRENVGWTAWSIGSHWTPGMLDFDFNVKGGEYFHGWFVKEWLHDARNDHAPPVAQSGEDGTFEGPPEYTTPASPDIVGLEENDDGSITVTFSHDVRANDLVTWHYNLQVDGETRKQALLLTLANEQADGDFTKDSYEFSVDLTGFTPGDTYDVSVVAVDSMSQASPPSNTQTYEPTGELETHAELPKTGTAPTIDGEVDDVWDDAPFSEFQHVPTGSVDSDADLDGGWRGMWDDEALYILVDVTDDERVVNDSEGLYNDDSAELFVDGDNSKLSAYDEVNDHQLVLPRGEDDEAELNGPVSAEDVEYAVAETDDGWRIEVAMSWSGLAPNVDIEAGSMIGFDCHVNDDDSGGDREGKLSWFGEEDVAWNDPSAFANVKLVE